MHKIRMPKLKANCPLGFRLSFDMLGKCIPLIEIREQRPLITTPMEEAARKIEKSVIVGRKRDRQEAKESARKMNERLSKKEEKQIDCSKLLENLQDLVGIFASLSLVIVLFVSCASFTKEGVYIKKADNLKYFSLGSHNRNSVGNRTDLGIGVPIQGVPVKLDVGGNGFLTDKKIQIDEVKDVEYYEVLSRNEDMGDIGTAMESIPKEFFEYSQFGDK